MNRGNLWLRAIMGEVAWASIKTKASYFYAQFHRIARRRGRNEAAIAVAHGILTAVYHVLRTGQPYADVGVDYFDRLDASRIEASPRSAPRATRVLGEPQAHDRLTPPAARVSGESRGRVRFPLSKPKLRMRRHSCHRWSLPEMLLVGTSVLWRSTPLFARPGRLG
jgi:hypothetical protein